MRPLKRLIIAFVVVVVVVVAEFVSEHGSTAVDVLYRGKYKT